MRVVVGHRRILKMTFLFALVVLGCCLYLWMKKSWSVLISNRAFCFQVVICLQSSIYCIRWNLVALKIFKLGWTCPSVHIFVLLFFFFFDNRHKIYICETFTRLYRLEYMCSLRRSTWNASLRRTYRHLKLL